MQFCPGQTVGGRAVALVSFWLALGGPTSAQDQPNESASEVVSVFAASTTEAPAWPRPGGGGRGAMVDGPPDVRAFRWSVDPSKAFWLTFDLNRDVSMSAYLVLRLRTVGTSQPPTNLSVRLVTSKGNYYRRRLPALDASWRDYRLPLLSFARRGKPDRKTIALMQLVGFRSERPFAIEIADAKLVNDRRGWIAGTRPLLGFDDRAHCESVRAFASDARLASVSDFEGPCLVWDVTSGPKPAWVDVRPVPTDIRRFHAVSFRARTGSEVAAGRLRVRLYDARGRYIEGPVEPLTDATRVYRLRFGDMQAKQLIDPRRVRRLRFLVPKPGKMSITIDDIRFEPGVAGDDSWLCGPCATMRFDGPSDIRRMRSYQGALKIDPDAPGGPALRWEGRGVLGWGKRRVLLSWRLPSLPHLAAARLRIRADRPLCGDEDVFFSTLEEGKPSTTRDVKAHWQVMTVPLDPGPKSKGTVSIMIELERPASGHISEISFLSAGAAVAERRERAIAEVRKLPDASSSLAAARRILLANPGIPGVPVRRLAANKMDFNRRWLLGDFEALLSDDDDEVAQVAFVKITVLAFAARDTAHLVVPQLGSSNARRRQNAYLATSRLEHHATPALRAFLETDPTYGADLARELLAAMAKKK